MSDYLSINAQIEELTRATKHIDPTELGFDFGSIDNFKAFVRDAINEGSAGGRERLLRLVLAVYTRRHFELHPRESIIFSMATINFHDAREKARTLMSIRGSPPFSRLSEPFLLAVEDAVVAALHELIENRSKLVKLRLDLSKTEGPVFKPETVKSYLHVEHRLRCTDATDREIRLVGGERVDYLIAWSSSVKGIGFYPSALACYIARGRTVEEIKQKLQEAMAHTGRWDDLVSKLGAMSDFELIVNMLQEAILTTSLSPAERGIHHPRFSVWGKIFVDMMQAWFMRNTHIIFAKCQKSDFDSSAKPTLSSKFPAWMNSEALYISRVNQFFDRHQTGGDRKRPREEEDVLPAKPAQAQHVAAKHHPTPKPFHNNSGKGYGAHRKPFGPAKKGN